MRMLKFFRRRWVQRSLLGLFIFGLAGTAAAIVWWRNVVVPALDRELAGLEDWRPLTTVRVLDSRGDVVDRFFLVRRVWVPITELPPVLMDAVIAAEDRRFHIHAGIDVWGMLRAAGRNFWAGRVREGGSTITQQVVKNVVVGSKRTYTRKLKEMLLAGRLEQRMNKQAILELYLNLIYLGSGNHGVEAAAQDYFGVSARELTLSQSSLLAGLIPAPSRYSPRASPKEAEFRRRLVLDTMVQMGIISDGEAVDAAADRIDPPPRGGEDRVGGEGFLTEARREIRRLLGEEVPFEVGLRVHTSFDPEIQANAEAAIAAATEAVEERQGLRLDLQYLSEEEQASFQAEAANTSTKSGDCFPVLALDHQKVASGARILDLAPEAATTKVWNADPEGEPSTFGRVVEPGTSFEGCLTEEGTIRPRAKPYVEGAAVVMEFQSGRVVALVGGRDMPLEGFHRATQARRQAGSAFKPFVFAAAMDFGQCQLDAVLDGPLALDAGGNKLWEPQNASRGFWGRPVPLRWAFAYSLNTVAVRLVIEHGTTAVVQRARAAGILSPLRRDLTMALGTSEIRAVELATGIAGIVRGGVAVQPVYIDKLVDLEGQELGRAGAQVSLKDVSVRLPGGDGARFLKPSSAWEVVEMMRSVVDIGTGKDAALPGQDRGGKTGTTSKYRDAWFVGFTPRHVIAIWIGQDDGETLGRGESGGRAALPAWKQIADSLPDGPELVPPSEVIPMPFNGRWIEVAADNVPSGRLKWRLPERPEPLGSPPDERLCR